MGRPVVYKSEEEKKKAILESKKNWKNKKVVKGVVEVDKELVVVEDVIEVLPKVDFHKLVLLRVPPSINCIELGKKLYPTHMVIILDCPMSEYKNCYINNIAEAKVHLENGSNVVVVNRFKLLCELDPYLSLCDDVGVIKVVVNSDCFMDVNYYNGYESFKGDVVINL